MPSAGSGRSTATPYDLSQIWVRDHRSERRPWIQATWKQLHRAPVPFGDLAWDYVSHQMPGSTEAEIADAVAPLLTRAHAGPKPKATRRDRRVAARTKAAGPSTPLPAPTADEPAPAPEPAKAEEKLADVIPLSRFDPLEDPWRRR